MWMMPNFKNQHDALEFLAVYAVSWLIALSILLALGSIAVGSAVAAMIVVLLSVWRARSIAIQTYEV